MARSVRLAVSLVLLGLGISRPAAAGPLVDPPPEPRIVACYDRLATSVQTSCSHHIDHAIWFFAIRPSESNRVDESVHRFDAATGAMTRIAVDAPDLPAEIGEAWQAFRDERARPRAWPALPTPLAPRRGYAKHFEILHRAILVEEHLEYRLHPLPWPTWTDVARWLPRTSHGRLNPGVLEWLRKDYGERAPGATLGTYAHAQGRLFFGLNGGFSEGMGAFGGMAIFDLEGETWHVQRPDELLEATASGVVATLERGAVWIGTLYPGEYGPGPASGLVRFDTRTCDWGRFESFEAGDGRLDGDLVWFVRSAGGAIWVSTENGISRIDLRHERIRNFAWAREEPTPDSAFALRADRPARVVATQGTGGPSRGRIGFTAVARAGVAGSNAAPRPPRDPDCWER